MGRTWQNGNWSSSPSDEVCFIERADDGPFEREDQIWRIYRLDDSGGLLEGFPLLVEQDFPSVEAAQAWVATEFGE